MGLRQDGLEHKLPARADGLGWFYRWRLAGWLTWQAKIQVFYEKKQNQELRSCAKKTSMDSDCPKGPADSVESDAGPPALGGFRLILVYRRGALGTTRNHTRCD